VKKRANVSEKNLWAFGVGVGTIYDAVQPPSENVSTAAPPVAKSMWPDQTGKFINNHLIFIRHYHELTSIQPDCGRPLHLSLGVSFTVFRGEPCEKHSASLPSHRAQA
jgi:hypothetical protein